MVSARYENEINPNYPMMAWDPKGTRITVIYSEEGKLKLFVYDVITSIKQYKIDLTDKFRPGTGYEIYARQQNLIIICCKKWAYGYLHV